MFVCRIYLQGPVAGEVLARSNCFIVRRPFSPLIVALAFLQNFLGDDHDDADDDDGNDDDYDDNDDNGNDDKLCHCLLLHFLSTRVPNDPVIN